MANEVKFETYGNPYKGADYGLAATNLATAIRISAQAKALAPIDKGQLRNSIMWKTKGSYGGFNSTSGDKASTRVKSTPRNEDAIVGFNLDYGHYQEFGTRLMSPQPFLRPAAAEVKTGTGQAEIKRINQKWMNEQLKKGKKNVPV